MKYILFIFISVFSLRTYATQLSNIYTETKEAVVQIQSINNKGKVITTGTGFYIFNENSVVTNYHVIKDAPFIQIINASGSKHIVQNIKFISAKKDIAILTTAYSSYFLEVAESKPNVGADVFTIGNPLGLESTLSTGIISGLRNTKDALLIQTTTPISRGSSGGPLMTKDGKVIGITTFYLSESQNLNFAVSVQKINEELMSGEYKHLFLEKTIKINYGSSESVAEAFYTAMKNDDLERAISFVYPAEQDEWSKSLVQDEFPDIGTIIFTQSFYSSVGAKIKGLPTAQVSLQGIYEAPNATMIGLDMVKKYNRWWIVR